MTLTCPRCQAAVAPGDRFCADCGSRIAPPDPAPPGTRAEAISAGLAGQTDPGIVHTNNQDAFAISGPDLAGGQGDRAHGTILVVADGVSNSQSPEMAAATAVQVVHAALASAGKVADRTEVMRDAIRQGHDAVCALPFDRQADIDRPATTIVAAWLDADGATIGWLGDSRAYLLCAAGARQITRDHSWIAMVVERGEMDEAQARSDPRAHALLHCLGTTDFARTSRCPEPGIALVPRSEAWLVLCTDGLWNYADTPTALLRAAGDSQSADAAALCRRLIEFARRRGGRDNVTVAAARL